MFFVGTLCDVSSTLPFYIFKNCYNLLQFLLSVPAAHHPEVAEFVWYFLASVAVQVLSLGWQFALCNKSFKEQVKPTAHHLEMMKPRWLEEN